VVAAAAAAWQRKSKNVPRHRHTGALRCGAVYSRDRAPLVFSLAGQPALPGGLPPARRRGKAGKRDARTGKNPRVIKCCTSLTFARHDRTHGEALSRALSARARRRRCCLPSRQRSRFDIIILSREYNFPI